MEIVFDKPIYLLFLFSLPVLIVFHYFTLRYVRGRVLQFANFVALSRVANPDVQPRNIPQLVIRLFTLSLLVFAVAGTHIDYMEIGAESDYVLAIDISSSMLTADLEPSRIEAAKKAAIDFVSGVPTETSIGLVGFSGTAFVNQELTSDKELLVQKINEMHVTSIGGTDLGEAIISSANLLFQGKNAKTIIVLTDGRSNIGVSVETAINYVNDNNMQIFTIGIGTLEGGSPSGMNLTLSLDDELLRQIAESTSGRYVYAKNTYEIVDAYKNVVSLTEKKTSFDLTISLLVLAFLLSFVDWLLLNTRYKRIP